MRSMPALYNGNQFSSRLEARWALWLDLVGIRWSYEPEVLELSGNPPITYIPDFFLPDWQAWVEIKGELVDDKTALLIIEKCRRVALQSPYPIILCFDQPYDPKCAVFWSEKMRTDARWSMCNHCGAIALAFGEKVRCKSEHTIDPLSLANQRLRDRFIYEAAVQARQARFAWPKRKAS